MVSATDTAPSEQLKDEEVRSEKFYDQTGDVIVLSADGKQFRTHAYHLMSASTVLRDTFEIGRRESKPLELNLTDMKIEHSTVLTFVFEQIIDHGTIFELKICDNSTVDALGQVIRFLQKFEMQRELLIARYQLASALRSAKSPIAIFSLAALLSDHELCGDALATGDWTYNAVQQGAFGESVESGNVFDISAMPLERLIWLSTETLWTLARASRKNPRFENDTAKC